MRSSTIRAIASELRHHRRGPEMIRELMEFDSEEFQHDRWAECCSDPDCKYHTGDRLINLPIAVAVYWIGSDYHEGQWCPLYAAMCATEYNPGPMETGPEGETPERWLYEDLRAILEDTGP
jgi:hypothetical protein